MSGLSLHIYINRRHVDFVGYIKNYWTKRLNNMFNIAKTSITIFLAIIVALLTTVAPIAIILLLIKVLFF